MPAHVMRYDAQKRLALDGEIALRGHPIVHSGKASFLRSDQQRIYEDLATMEDHAVIARVERGVIVGLRATGGPAARAADMLQALFDVDSRYRVLWEIGFGINTELDLFPGNAAMNEVWGAAGGVFHLGTGLTPHTQYAPIFLCPGSKVLGRNGEVLLGAAPAQVGAPDRPGTGPAASS